MAETDDRLRRLVAADVGECRDGDVAARLDDLRALVDRAVDEETAAVFGVLGDGTRYRLARVLSASEEERCVCELAPLVDVSESAVSHALADLADAGLATRRTEGNWRYYASTDLADALFAAADRGGGDE